MTTTVSGATVGKDSLRTFAATLLGTVLGILTGILIARWLGPAGKGSYNSLQLVVSVVVSVTTGIGASITYFLTNKRRQVSEILPALGILLLIISAVLWAGIALWSLMHGLTKTELLFAAVVPASVALSWGTGFYLGIGRLKTLNYQTIGLAAATLVAVAVVVGLLKQGATEALVAWIACVYGAAGLVVVRALLAARGQATGSMREHFAALLALVRFGAQTGVNNALGLLNYRIDSLLLIALLGVSAFGVYSIAVAAGEALLMVSRSVTMAVVRDIGSGDLATSGAITARVVRVCTATVFAFAVAAFVVGPSLIGLVYGPRFQSAGMPLRILLPGIVAFSTAGAFCTFFQFQLGKPVIVTCNNVAMIAVQAVACVLLVPRLGLSGAALASTVTYIVGAVLQTWWFCKATGIRIVDVWVVRRSDAINVYRVALKLAVPYA